MKNRFSKLLSLLLSVCMILSMASFTVFADEAEATSSEPTYYVKWGGTGNGLSPESPVATVKDAVTKINAAGYGAGDTVIVYIMNDDTLTEAQTAGKASADFYRYDANGNFVTSIVGTSKGGTTVAGRFTSWNGGNGGNPGSHAATLHIQGYTEDSLLFYSKDFGGTGSLELGGPTIFEDITLVANRFCDCRLRSNGFDVAYNDVTFKYQEACSYSGKNSATDNTAFTLKNGHPRISVTTGAGQTKPGSTTIINSVIWADTDTRYGVIVADEYNTTFTGHVKYYLNGNSTNGSISWGNGASTFKDGLSVVANAGTYKHQNRNSNVTTITGGLQFVANNGAAFTNLSAISARYTADGVWQMNSADTTGNALDVTDTAGTFTVKGGNVAYVVANDCKSVTYSVDNKLTVPAGTYNVSYAADVATIKEEVVAFEDAANIFVEWVDNGNGTLTAKYQETGADVVYYVKHKATGNGLSASTPGTFATVVADINKKYGADDTIIIKIVKADNEADAYTDISKIALASFSDIPAHEAMLVLTSANENDLSYLTHINDYTLNSALNNGSNVELSGPTTVKNIKLLDNRMNWHADFYCNNHDFVIGEGVTWYTPSSNGTTLTLNGAKSTPSIQGGSRSYKTLTDSGRIVIPSYMLGTIRAYTASGYDDDGVMVFNKDITYELASGTSSNITIDDMKNNYAHFKKNVNFVLNGTTVPTLAGKSSASKGSIIEGAIQIIKNSGAKITTNTASAHTSTARDTLAPIYDITVENGVTLDVTETAGVYTVAGENIAYAQSADKETAYYSVDGVLTLPEAGAWTIKNAADMTALKAALAIPTYSIQYTFDKWVDDGEGVLVATAIENSDAEIFKYYVKYGGTGDGRTYEAPAGTIKAAIESINADGWKKGDNVTIYLVPTGKEPTMAQLNATSGDAVVAEGKTMGFITYTKPGAYHKATITYTTYNYGAEGVEKMILSSADTINGKYAGGHVYLTGPTVFKDIMFIGARLDAYEYDLYTQSYDFEAINVDWRGTSTSGYTNEKWNSHFYFGNHGSDQHYFSSTSDYVAKIDDPSFAADFNLICRGEKTGTSYIYFGNDAKATTISNLMNTNNDTSIQHGVLNVILNNTTVQNLGSTSGKKAPTADAVQFILNNKSSIAKNNITFNADVYYINVADGGKLDATDVAGVYTVTSSKKYAYAYAGGDKIFYAEAGKSISVDAPGTYEVGFFDNLSDVKTTYTVNVPGYEFAGWIDDGKGTLSASAKPVADTDAMYYAMYGGKGDGRTPAAPANTVADAINSINADVAAGKLTAGQEVTVYVSSASDWNTFNADVLVGKNAGVKDHHMTAWKVGGGQPNAYSVVLNVQSFDCLNISYMPTNEKLGYNGSLMVNGVTKFSNIAIVDTRMGYRELMAVGNNVTFGENTVIAHLDLGSAEADAKWGGKFGYDAGNITVGKYDKGTYDKDVVVTFNNSFNMQGNDRGVFLGSSVSNPSVFNGNVSVYFNNPAIMTSLQWQGSSTTGTNTFNKNLNLIFSDAANIIYQTRGGAAVTIKNLQIIAKDGIKFRSNNNAADIKVTDIPANVTVTGGKWILKLAKDTENFLDVTATAGTFTVKTGMVAKATNDATGAVTLSSAGKLVLEEGIYTISAMDKSEVEAIAVNVTFDGKSDGNLYIAGQQFALPTYENELLREFKGWTLDGTTIIAGGTIQTCGEAGSTLAYTSVWENFADTVVIYVDGNSTIGEYVKGTQPTVTYIGNGSDDNDGLTRNTAVKTLAKAFEIANARPESIKKIAIIGNYPYTFSLPANTSPVIITGDGSDNSAITLYWDSIWLNGDVKFENIILDHTSIEGGKTLYTDSYNLEFGEGVEIDSALNVRLGGDHTGRWGNKLTGTLKSGVFTLLEVGNFWVYTNRATASGADVVIDGARITNLNFTSNGWMATQLGCDYTGPVRVLVNSGYVGTIDMTTQAESSSKYAKFNDSVEILANNGAVGTISDQFTAPNGVWIVKANKADDGSYLKYTDTKGKYEIVGDMTAIAKTPDGQQFVSINGVLTVPAGIYTVEFVDKIEYLVNGDTVSFYSTVTLDISTLKVPLHEGKAFIGWFYADGTAPAYKNTQFKPGDVITAKYIDYAEQTGTGLETAGDFFIKGAQIRLGATETNTVNGLRYIVEMNDAFFTELTQYSSSIINPENPNYGTLILPTTLTKGRSMFYNKPIVVEWNLNDGKLGSKTNPFDLDQAYNATPITTNSVFSKAYTPSAVPAVNTFGKTTDSTLYTLCLTGVTEERFTEFYSVRGYIRYIDANGFERVWYSDYYQTNMYTMAKAAVAGGETGTFLTEVIEYVEAKPGEGGQFDAYMAENYTNRTLLSGYPTTADKDPNHAMYVLSNGLKVREVEINYSGSTTDDPVEIIHFADTHLNWINEEDLYNAVPSTISTYRGRSWLRNGSSTAAITTALEYGMLFDQVVITGDIMDYFSYGCAEIMQKLIVDRDKNAMLALGNHEPAELMQNDATVGTYYGGRTGIYPVLQDIWPNDIYYYSKVIYNDTGDAKALCVTLNNEQDTYIAEQGVKLQADIDKARELGIPVLIFQHDPICSNNPDLDPVWYIYEAGDWSWLKWSDASSAVRDNFPKEGDYILATIYNPEIHDAMGLTPYKVYTSVDTLFVNCPSTNAKLPNTNSLYSQRGAGRASSDATTKEVYNVIVSNADVVRGVFCGHVHNHMYTEIKASYVKDGATVETVIPQYCVTANAYNKGNVIKITVK